MSVDAHVLELLPAFALGSLDAEEAGQVQQHLSSCLICRSELTDYQDVTAQLALMVSPIAPPAGLKGRLMERVQTSHPQPQILAPAPARPLLERLLPAWGVASLVLLFVLGAVNLFLWQRLVDQNSFTGPGGMRAIPLRPLEVDSIATGFVVVSVDGNNGALVVDGLPPLDESQQYQLWLIRDGERTSGAVFSTDEVNYGGTRIRAPRSLLDYTAVAITIEPAGGSTQPTGTEILGGLLQDP